jgi:hypothetical protein
METGEEIIVIHSPSMLPNDAYMFFNPNGEMEKNTCEF